MSPAPSLSNLLNVVCQFSTSPAPAKLESAGTGGARWVVQGEGAGLVQGEVLAQKTLHAPGEAAHIVPPWQMGRSWQPQNKRNDDARGPAAPPRVDGESLHILRVVVPIIPPSRVLNALPHRRRAHTTAAAGAPKSRP
eukprot:scaffold24485_cov54-Phaeocystis_antarctica.AAC.1